MPGGGYKLIKDSDGVILNGDCGLLSVVVTSRGTPTGPMEGDCRGSTPDGGSEWCRKGWIRGIKKIDGDRVIWKQGPLTGMGVSRTQNGRVWFPLGDSTDYGPWENLWLPRKAWLKHSGQKPPEHITMRTVLVGHTRRLGPTTIPIWKGRHAAFEGVLV